MTKSAYCVALTAYKNAPVNWGVGKFLERGKYQKGGGLILKGGGVPNPLHAMGCQQAEWIWEETGGSSKKAAAE